MRVGIIQSNYIPWRGYFDFIDDVDLFMFYDDVQYTHKNWRNRNKIKTHQGPLWISVPVMHDSSTLIQDARISYDNRWIDKHVRSITLAYQSAPYFDLYANDFFDILRLRLPTISDLNVTICKWVMQKLRIETPTIMSGKFSEIKDTKFERPIRILKILGATHFLSGGTAKEYTNIENYKAAGITLEFKSYEYSAYPQLHGPFEPFVTVLDLLFNCGENSRTYLKSTKASVKAY